MPVSSLPPTMLMRSMLGEAFLPDEVPGPEGLNSASPSKAWAGNDQEPVKPVQDRAAASLGRARAAAAASRALPRRRAGLEHAQFQVKWKPVLRPELRQKLGL